MAVFVDFVSFVGSRHMDTDNRYGINLAKEQGLPEQFIAEVCHHPFRAHAWAHFSSTASKVSFMHCSRTGNVHDVCSP